MTADATHPPVPSPDPIDSVRNTLSQPDSQTQSDRLAQTRLPGVFLILSGGINILAGLVFVAMGIHGHLVSIHEFRQRLEIEFPDQHKEIAASGWPLEYWIWNTSTGILVLGLGGILTGGLVLWGIWRLWRGGSSRLAFIGAILISLPGISPTGCLAIGTLAGLWMILVLFDPE